LVQYNYCVTDVLKTATNNWDKYLNEMSGLSRVWRHMEKYDAAFISAERDDAQERTNCMETNSPQDKNRLRTRDLKAALLGRGYGVTAVSGNYIENFETPQAVEVAENSFFVINLKHSETFLQEIEKLGEYFCQDSVLLVPLDEKGYLMGTNNTDFPGYGLSVDVGRPVFGEEGEFMTRVNNRPLIFKETMCTYEGLTRLARMVVKVLDSKIIL